MPRQPSRDKTARHRLRLAGNLPALYRLPWWRRWLTPWRRYRLSCQSSAPSRVEGVGELALELELMANRAADDSRFGDAHFLFRAAHILKRRHHSSSVEGKAQS
jgi:hypothetical protein